MSEPKELIAVPAVVEDFKPKKDRSWVLKFETRELTSDEVKVLVDNYQGEGWLVFSPNHINTSQIPVEQADAGVKSPSKRLKDVIFIYWKQNGSKGDFDAYYKTTIQKMIESIQEKLEPREG